MLFSVEGGIIAGDKKSIKELGLEVSKLSSVKTTLRRPAHVIISPFKTGRFSTYYMV
jgi:hypothetical protein